VASPVRRVLLLLAVLAGLALFVGGTIGLALVVAGNGAKPETPLAQNTVPPAPVPAPNPGPEVGPGPAPNPNPPNPNPPNPNPPNPPNPNPPNPNPPDPMVRPDPNPMPMPMPEPGPGRRLPRELQEKVNAAIEKGVAFLRSQDQNGTFQGTDMSHPNGSHFLVGLTLLECGMAPTDPVLQRLAARGRDYARRGFGMIHTYEVSLALLFLDRLNDPADKPLIQALALLLLGGQGSDGGWGYSCPALSPDTRAAFLAALQRARPEKAAELIVRDGSGRLIDLGGQVLDEGKLDDKTLQSIEAGYKKLLVAQQELKRFPELQMVPFLRTGEEAVPPFGQPQPGVRGGRVRLPRLAVGAGQGDNSNSQFAALGLWVASRHDVPCERALALLAARARVSQGRGGAWSYNRTSEETPTMTCSGLLALAIGHGLRKEEAGQKRDDPQIHAGLTYLAENVHKSGDNLARNLYFVWSLERMGVLFNLEKVGDIDWYEWGAKHLVASQSPQGTWALGGYQGSIALHDTCFVLLFLKRANLAQDLSNKIEQILDIKGAARQKQN
jgi:hypothetical protein